MVAIGEGMGIFISSQRGLVVIWRIVERGVCSSSMKTGGYQWSLPCWR